MQRRRFVLTKFAKENPIKGDDTPTALDPPQDVAADQPVPWCDPPGDKPIPR